MVQEAVDSGFAEAGEFLAEVDEFTHSGVWVIVSTLHRGFGAKNVGY